MRRGERGSQPTLVLFFVGTQAETESFQRTAAIDIIPAMQSAGHMQQTVAEGNIDTGKTMRYAGSVIR